MSFDRNDPANLLALKTEVNTDPIGMGYAGVNNTAAILKLLNAPANNVGGETAAAPFTVENMLVALVPTELDAQQTNAGAGDYINALVTAGGQFGGVDIEQFKTDFRAMFAGNSATVAALDAQTAALSRAEVLFGQGTSLSRDDWIAARDS